jgi:hypothetical protein
MCVLWFEREIVQDASARDSPRLRALGYSKCADSFRRREHFAQRATIDDAHRGAARFGEAEHDRELAILLDELFRAVDGVDEDGIRGFAETLVGLRIALFRDERDAREIPGEMLEQKNIRFLVGACDRVVRSLHLHAGIRLGIDAHDDLRRGGGRLHELLHHVFTVDHV